MGDREPKFILASSSPRRKDILGAMGIEFDVVPADVDEALVVESNPKKLVKRLSLLKANAVKANDAVVIAADTIVVKGGKVYGKPLTDERAVQMIQELSGCWHTVYTGVTVEYLGKVKTFVEKSKVKFNRLSDSQIREYVDAYRPLDKAGAYGIQDETVVETYKGSYTNIVGLPKEKLSKILEKLGVYYGIR
ncbi:MAG: septum formation protein Maf [Clostridia bacterium]|nr:septum formation protein Maf [Clostridia bacterium]